MRSCIVAMCLLAIPALAASQRVAPVPVDAGARVRIWTDTTASALQARVHAVDAHGLTLTGVEGETQRNLPLVEIDRIDVSRGKNRWAWTSLGMLAGATAGIIISRVDNDAGDNPGGLDETAEGLANTFSGALLGGVVGFFVAPERWRTIWRR